MSSWMTHSLVLRGLCAVAMGKAFLRYRNPRRRAVGRAHEAFHEHLWRDTAAELGVSWRPLGSGIAELEISGRYTRVMENVTAIDDPVTLAAAHDKPLTSRLLREAGVSVARHATFSLKRMSPAVEFLESLGRDCVVKPASGTGGGRGITTGVRTRWHLARAAAAASVYCDELMIEEQIDGDNYRLLFLDGQMIDAFVRRLPAVAGDGRTSVRDLVRRLNNQRVRAGAGLSQVLISVDLDMHRTLAKQGLSLRSVPEPGRRVTLKTVVNENGGADNTTATGLLCRAVVEECARAVRAMRIRFAGIDVVTRDPGVPLAESGGVVLEVNGTPNLYYHYHKQDGVFPAAAHVLRRLLLDEPRLPASAQPHSYSRHTQEASRV